MIDVAHVNELCLQGNRSIAMVVLCGLLSCGNGVGRMLWYGSFIASLVFGCLWFLYLMCSVVCVCGGCMGSRHKVSIFLIDRERGYGSEISTSTENK